MSAAPEATLLLAPGCPYCPQVLAALSELVKQGVLGRLEVVNIAVHPEAAEAVGTRSVPWIRIGPYELTGNHGAAELRQWAERAARGEGIAAWYHDALQGGRLQEALARVKRNPEELEDLLGLLEHPPGDEELPITVRIGISAIVEDLAGTELLKRVRPMLERLTRSPEAATRADAAHYLGLVGDPSVASILRPLTEDEAEQVREIAREALESVGHTIH